jgi:ribose 1,5-bisphosphokinase
MPGRLIYIMGPSGAGKDTVMRGVVQRLGTRALIAHRVVTRGAHSEDAATILVGRDEFSWMEASGLFAMAWHANDLDYGVLRHIDKALLHGRDVFISGSRAYLPEAVRRYPRLIPVLVTAEAALLRHRLVARGREDQDQIEARLARNERFLDLEDAQRERLLRIDNSGAPGLAAQILHGLLQAAGKREAA